MKDTRWVSFGRHRQRVSELSPELRQKLGIEELPEPEEKVYVRRKRVSETEDSEEEYREPKRKTKGRKAKDNKKGLMEEMFDGLCEWLRKPAK